MDAPPGPMAAGARPAGSSALFAALASSALMAAVTLLAAELQRASSDDARQRVFAPRVTRRLAARRQQGAAAHADAVRAVPSEMLFAWLGPVLRAPDDDALLAELGVDSVLYIKLTRLCLHLLLATALFDLTAVLAANVAGAHLVRGPESDLGRLTMAHVPPGSPTLWVHFFSVLLKTGVLVALTYRLSAWVAAQQEALADARLRRPEGRVVLVTDVPGGVAAARAAFAHLYPRTFLAAIPALDTAMCDALLAEREALLLALEAARAEAAAAAEAALPGDADAAKWRPTHRTGWLGLSGPRVDTIAEHVELLGAVEARLGAARDAALACAASEDAPQRAAAYLAFATPRAAAEAARAVLSRDTHAWRLSPAAAPHDVVWHNVGRYGSLPGLFASAAALAVTYGLVAFYMVPVAAVSALSTLTNLSHALPFLADAVRAPAARALLEGLLPGLVLLIFMAVLPVLMRVVALSAGVRTRSELACEEVRALFLFSAVNVFLGHVVAGSVLSDLRGVVGNAGHPGAVLAVLGDTLPRTSKFFITLVALKSFAGAAAQATPLRVCFVHLLRARRPHSQQRTPLAAAAAWAPCAGIVSGGVADILLVALLTIVFSTIAPLMHIVGIVFFALRLGAVKACVLYRHEPGYEGGGAIWAPVRWRLFAAALIYQATLAGIFALKRAPAPAVLLVAVVMPATAAAARAMAHRFDAAAPGRGAHPLLAWAAAAAAEAPAAEGEATEGEGVPLVQRSACAGHADVADAEDALLDGAALLAPYLPPCLQPPPALAELEIELNLKAAPQLRDADDVEGGALEARGKEAAARQESVVAQSPSARGAGLSPASRSFALRASADAQAHLE